MEGRGAAAAGRAVAREEDGSLSRWLGELATREPATARFAFGVTELVPTAPRVAGVPPPRLCRRAAGAPPLPFWLTPALLRLLNSIMNSIKTTSKKRFVCR